MKLFLRHILSISLASLILFSSCSGKGGKVIPRGTLAEIYAEMFVTDQWLASNLSLKKMADTSFVYAPILERYGYTPDDYRLSLDHYMNDPERYARILRTTSELLDARLEELKVEQARLARIAAIKVYESDLKPEDFAMYLRDSLIMYHDSISFEPDSARMIYWLRSHEVSDTLYEGVAMTIKTDSLEVKSDSLEVVDTLKAITKVKVKEARVLEDSLLTETKPMKVGKLKGVKIDKLKSVKEFNENKE